MVALVAGGVAVQQALEDDRPPPVTAAEVFGSSDTRTETIEIRGGQARIGMSRELGRIAIDASYGRVYQLWIIDDAGPHSAGVVDRPSLTLAIPDRGAQVAMTTEPTGGSAQPTTEPLFTVQPSDL